MKSHTLFGTAASLALGSMMLGCAGMKLERVPPGQSIRHHLEGPPQQATETLPPPAGVELPTTVGDNPSMGTDTAASPGQANPNFAGRSEIIGALPGTARAEALPPLPVSGLPERNDSIERAGEAYNRGNLLMKGGKNNEAVAAFEETRASIGNENSILRSPTRGPGSRCFTKKWANPTRRAKHSAEQKASTPNPSDSLHPSHCSPLAIRRSHNRKIKFADCWRV